MAHWTTINNKETYAACHQWHAVVDGSNSKTVSSNPAFIMQKQRHCMCGNNKHWGAERKEFRWLKKERRLEWGKASKDWKRNVGRPKPKLWWLYVVHTDLKKYESKAGEEKPKTDHNGWNSLGRPRSNCENSDGEEEEWKKKKEGRRKTKRQREKFRDMGKKTHTHTPRPVYTLYSDRYGKSRCVK